jgi:drug/metabolite transporter (DMT)-like permease
MADLTPSSLGLFLAAATSITNVFTDVARKKVVDRHDVVASTFSFKVVAGLIFAAAMCLHAHREGLPVLRDGGPVFGVAWLHLAPLPTFLVYLILDTALVGCATLFYLSALQASPLSLCVPFLAFTPIFLIGTGYLVLGELPSTAKLAGVVLVVVGSLVMHRKLVAVSWFEPVRAVFREKGSRYMLLVALILSVTNPLDKKLVLMSDAFTQAFAYAVGLCILFSLLVIARRADTWGVIRAAPGWVVVAGALDASVLLLQFSSHNYIDVVITLSIKRAGIVLAVLCGWLFFRERHINDKLIAVSVMLAGVLILYLPMTLAHALALGCAALGGMTVALCWTGGSASVAEADLPALAGGHLAANRRL